MSSTPFPSPDLLREIGKAAQGLADLLFRYMPLDSGDNPGSLPGFSGRGMFGILLPAGGPREPVYHLERLLFRLPGWLMDKDDYGDTSLGKCNPDLFFTPIVPHGWDDTVQQAIEALRKNLGALKWYLDLPLAAYVGTD